MFEDSDGGISWFKVLGTALLTIATAIGGFFLARKFNLFGLGSSNVAGSGGSASPSVVDETKMAIFKPQMPLSEAKTLAEDSSKEMSNTSRNQLRAMLTFIESSGKKEIGVLAIPQGDGTKKDFSEAELLNNVSIGIAGRFTFMNAVSLKQLREIAVSQDEAKKYFPDMGTKEYLAFKTGLSEIKSDSNQVLNLLDLTKLVTPMRPARKEDEKDKAASKPAAPAAAAPAPKVDAPQATPNPPVDETAKLREQLKKQQEELDRLKKQAGGAAPTPEGESTSRVTPVAQGASAPVAVGAGNR